MFRFVCLCIVSSCCAARVALAQTTAPQTDAPQQLYDRVRPSLVIVQYTLDTELGRHDLYFAGVVVSSDGLVMVPMIAVSDEWPDEQLKDFKIVVPQENSDVQELDAVFEGRDERNEVAFVRTKQPQKWTPIQFEDLPLNIGDTTWSIGLLAKSAGYRAYAMSGMVSASCAGRSGRFSSTAA